MGAKRSDRARRERKLWRELVHRSMFAHELVQNSSRRAPFPGPVAAGLIARIASDLPLHPAGTFFALPERRLVSLGAIAFLSVFAEASVNDWSALYLSAGVGMTPGAAAGGFSGYALMMFLGRAFGDGVVHRLGRTRVVALGALAVFAGMGRRRLQSDGAPTSRRIPPRRLGGRASRRDCRRYRSTANAERQRIRAAVPSPAPRRPKSEQDRRRHWPRLCGRALR